MQPTFMDSINFSMARQRIFPIGLRHEWHLFSIRIQQEEQAICPFVHWKIGGERDSMQIMHSKASGSMVAIRVLPLPPPGAEASSPELYESFPMVATCKDSPKSDNFVSCETEARQ